LRLWHSDPDCLARQVVEIEGRDVMERLEASGAPFLVVTGHFGNWEMLGAYFGERFRLSVVAKPLHNAALEDELSAKRKRYGMEILSTGSDQIGRDILRAVRRGRTVCFLADQDARKAGIFVPFFGRSASTFTGPALMALRLRIPLVPTFLLRLGPGRHRVVIREPLNPPEGLPTEQAVAALTQAHVKVLEDTIRLAPSQYFWFHRRWKTQPKP
jgi:KDO2-lipid IV(A) lauroyltransferase